MKVSTQQFKLKRLVLITGLILGMSACNTDDLAPPPPPPFVNTAPEISTTPVVTANEDQLYIYTFSATDLDADALTYSATSPAWLTIDGSTGILSGTPTTAEVGANEVTLSVSDGTDSVSQTFTITVEAALADNVAPIFTSSSSSAEVGAVDEAYSYAITASDANFDDLSLTFTGTLPAWATFTIDADVVAGTAAATLEGTPDIAGAYPVEITLSDGVADVVTQSFTISVSGPAVVTDVFVLYENAELPEWPAWIDSGGEIEFVTVETIGDEPERDMAVKFSLTGPSVSGFSSRTAVGGGGVNFDASDILSNGVVTFEIFLIENTTAQASLWEFKIEATGQFDAASANLNPLPTVGEWTKYEFPLSTFFANNAAVASKIELFMVFPEYSNAAGAVYLVDNFKVVTVVGGDPIVPPETGPELLSNGDFEAGDTSGWFRADGVVITEDGNNIFVADLQTASTETFDVGLGQMVELTEGLTYTLSYRAKASVERAITTGLGRFDPANDDFAGTESIINLTTEWQDFTADILIDETNGGPLGRVFFDIGGDIAVISIDDVIVEVKEEVIVVEVGTDLVSNGDFETGELSDEWFRADGTVVAQDGNNVFQADMATASTNTYDVSLGQMMVLDVGSMYKLSYRAKASKERTIITGLGRFDPPNNDFKGSETIIDLTTEWQDFTVDILIDDTNGGPLSRVFFDIGKDTGLINIDDVSVILLSVQ
jgi:hypothetical protein